MYTFNKQIVCWLKCQWAVHCQFDSQCANEARVQRSLQAPTIPVIMITLAGRHGLSRGLSVDNRV